MELFFDKKTFVKPPLGAAPCKIIQFYRINELASAIYRYSETSIYDTGNIKKWAVEIEKLCDVIQSVEGGDTND